MKQNPSKRFELILEESLYVGVNIRIIRDKHTGVLYLDRNNGGLTPLLDKDGKPIVDLNSIAL